MYPIVCADTSLKDGLFHEFKKHGKVTSVQIHGASEDRYGLVFFRQQEDQEKALGASKGKLFFGMQIEVTAWNGPGKIGRIENTKHIFSHRTFVSQGGGYLLISETCDYHDGKAISYETPR